MRCINRFLCGASWHLLVGRWTLNDQWYISPMFEYLLLPCARSISTQRCPITYRINCCSCIQSESLGSCCLQAFVHESGFERGKPEPKTSILQRPETSLWQNIEELLSKGTTLKFCTESPGTFLQAGRPPERLALPKTGKNKHAIELQRDFPHSFKREASPVLTGVIQGALYKVWNTLWEELLYCLLSVLPWFVSQALNERKLHEEMYVPPFCRCVPLHLHYSTFNEIFWEYFWGFILKQLKTLCCPAKIFLSLLLPCVKTTTRCAWKLVSDLAGTDSVVGSSTVFALALMTQPLTFTHMRLFSKKGRKGGEKLWEF